MSTDATGHGTISTQLPTSVPEGTVIVARLDAGAGGVSGLSNGVVAASAADLAVSLSAQAHQNGLRQEVDLSATVTNHGSGPATNVVLTITPSRDFLYALMPLPPGQFSTGPVDTLTIPTLAAGATETLVGELNTTIDSPVVFDATVTSTTPDPNPADNSASLSVVTPTTAPPTLTSVVLGSAATTVTGSFSGDPSTTYLIRFFSGSSPDTINPNPPGFGTANVTTDASGHADFVASLPATAQPAIALEAYATGPGGTTDLSNVVSATSSADLVLKIVPLPATIPLGGSIMVTATVTNLGPSTANEVLLTLGVPAGVPFGLEPVAPGDSTQFGPNSVTLRCRACSPGNRRR